MPLTALYVVIAVEKDRRSVADCDVAIAVERILEDDRLSGDPARFIPCRYNSIVGGAIVLKTVLVPITELLKTS
jgi:hypothetical protein